MVTAIQMGVNQSCKNALVKLLHSQRLREEDYAAIKLLKV